MYIASDPWEFVMITIAMLCGGLLFLFMGLFVNMTLAARIFTLVYGLIFIGIGINMSHGAWEIVKEKRERKRKYPQQ